MSLATVYKNIELIKSIGEVLEQTHFRTSNRDWWPNQLNLKILHQHSPRAIRWARIQLR
jgi:catalase (peroxidase I)